MYLDGRFSQDGNLDKAKPEALADARQMLARSGRLRESSGPLAWPVAQRESAIPLQSTPSDSCFLHVCGTARNRLFGIRGTAYAAICSSNVVVRLDSVG